MSAFRRILKYVWPQWPRIVVVVLGAITISLLLSLSFMTIIPLLKVMMGEEGLHGWVDRKTCNWRYGVDFYVPDMSDLVDQNGPDMIHSLVVIKVKKDGLASAAGLQLNDRIIGAGDFLVGSQADKISSTRLVQELATATEDRLTVQLQKIGRDSRAENRQIQIKTTADKAFMDRENWGFIRAVQWNIGKFFFGKAQKALSLLPRQSTKEGKTGAVIFIMAVMLVMTIIRCIAKFYQDYFAQKVVQVAVTDLRQDAFRHVMKMPVKYFVNEQASDTVSRLIRDSGAMGNGIKVLLGKALREPLNATVFLGSAMLINWQLTAVFLGGAPITVWLAASLGKKMKRATRKSLLSWAQMLSKLQETVVGLKIVKVYNRQDYEEGAFRAINKKLLKQLLKGSRVDAATMPTLEVIGMAAGLAAIVAGTHWINKGQLGATEFFVILFLLGSAAEAVRKTSDIWNKIQEANAAAERVFTLMDEPTEFEKPDAVELSPLKRKMEFRNISFCYPQSDRKIFDGLNLAIDAGQTVAVVGPNGSGKTTLVNLIPRFYDPNEGAVIFDGVDIRNASIKSLRGQISMVGQQVVTFNDTVAANIGYGKEDATMDEIIAAAKRAYAHEFIEPLPDGYETVIGENSSGFSGGQLQRIIIARSILKNPSILIFDEAMSQVDADSESKIHKALAEIMKNRTCFVIAHRFSTVISADSIVVMNNGQIAAQGTHEKLVKDCALYKSLYETQLIVT
ncbi:MAG: ABC transporter transmembrane domain-containing protein [Phycisphaerae bacterium]|nr:ABC transporter transmembrane domain-containing protein [Phycisphaerae bacterium]